MSASSSPSNRENLSLAQRLGELTVIVVQVLLFGFFWLHQSMHTGFFTAGFGTRAAICLFAPIVVSLAPPAVRALTGRRNPARPLEAAANLSLALGTLYLLIAFPLDFAHLADVFSPSLRFLLSWITDDVARIVMILQVIFMPISAAANLWQYVRTRRRTPTEPSRPKMA